MRHHGQQKALQIRMTRLHTEEGNHGATNRQPHSFGSLPALSTTRKEAGQKTQAALCGDQHCFQTLLHIIKGLDLKTISWGDR